MGLHQCCFKTIALLLAIHTVHFEQHCAHFCVYLLTGGCHKLQLSQHIPTLSPLGHPCVNQFLSPRLPTTMITHSHIHFFYLHDSLSTCLTFSALPSQPSSSYISLPSSYSNIHRPTTLPNFPPNLTKSSLTLLLSVTISRSSTPYSRFPDTTSPDPAPLSVFLLCVPVHAVFHFSLLRYKLFSFLSFFIPCTHANSNSSPLLGVHRLLGDWYEDAFEASALKHTS